MSGERRSATRLLIVEDDRVDAELGEARLGAESTDFDVRFCATLSQALKALDDDPPDVVLLDLWLSDSTGLDTLRAVLAHAGHVAVVAYTGAGGEVLGSEAIRAGAQDVVSKEAARGERMGQILRFAIERKRAENRLAAAFHRDALTGLASREAFMLRLDSARHRAHRDGSAIGIGFIDLDAFKAVNDAHGHRAGDALLIEVARRLSECVREVDVVARFGGDEFVVLLEDVGSLAGAAVVGQRMLAAIRAPVALPAEVLVSASVGVTVRRGDLIDGAGMLADADAAMYEAKRRGKNAVCTSEDLGRSGGSGFQGVGADLEAALERGEFFEVYQPIVDAMERRVIGLEVLLRWRHPEFGDLNPSGFLPLLRRAGLLPRVTRRVVARACRCLAELDQDGVGVARVHINVDPTQLAEGSLASDIGLALRETGVAPERVILEFPGLGATAVGSTLAGLSRAGVRLAVDGFRASDEALSALRAIRAACVKLDRDLVGGVSDDGISAALASAIARLASELEIEVIASGVESLETRDALMSRQITRLQGFLYAAPMEADDLRPWLARAPETLAA